MVVIKNKAYDSDPIGQVFTPNYIANFMIKNALNFIESPLPIALEPSAGKGVFLRFLIREEFKTIDAYEIDQVLFPDLLKTYPSVHLIFSNFLGSSETEEYDLIVGNPPYLGQNYNAQLFQEYVKKYPICEKYFVGNMDLFYYFIHKAILKLKPKGILSFITTNYWITKSKKTGIKLLKPHILDECFIRQYIDLSNLKLFKGAKGQHNCIFVLQKKTINEKKKKTNREIEIIKIKKNKQVNQLDLQYNEKIFTDLLKTNCLEDVMKYESALTNNDLNPEGSWNLLYPEEVKQIMDKIEKICVKNGKTAYLRDYFVIRNGLIFVKDDIFILKEDSNFKIVNDEYYIQINGKYHILSEKEKKNIKILYKSKSIKQFGHDQESPKRYAIFFNKNQFSSKKEIFKNRQFEEEYPLLTTYLNKFEQELTDILKNAKENPNDKYFPRRGAFIRNQTNKSNAKKDYLIDLEPYYDSAPKIFFKYISSDNIFGYADSSYYATSDTYFLWSKEPKLELEYPFILAYLNSKLVSFIFKAKNIKIKRSKTKLEDNLPLPRKAMFNSKKKQQIVELIGFLSSVLISLNKSPKTFPVEKFTKNLLELEKSTKILERDYSPSLYHAIQVRDGSQIKKIIDDLIFQLFDLREKDIDYLINKYYSI